MALKSIVVPIGRTQGIIQHMYTSSFRWNGSYDIVYVMGGTDNREANRLEDRLVEAYCAMDLYP
eukprot:8813258-Prorocentrum_lima.AAC.1